MPAFRLFQYPFCGIDALAVFPPGRSAGEMIVPQQRPEFRNAAQDWSGSLIFRIENDGRGASKNLEADHAAYNARYACFLGLWATLPHGPVG